MVTTASCRTPTWHRGCSYGKVRPDCLAATCRSHLGKQAAGTLAGRRFCGGPPSVAHFLKGSLQGGFASSRGAIADVLLDDIVACAHASRRHS
eukprot:CAMPEP_0206430458 /NCGR_PEP_ID=MMETSP0324_2-20121206/6827_1 /ASSEMBLY_ACC=CAM_ASM_000836 /TAXON_ID=2866 /ORGANISM="Crypthecodinium cohnii, Strain Seligo" /LENGTH=92 /DNA_ID=CAMNT_0053896291 /DNA_START=497 /DNA_END=772 /DNA_ORIENTATION=-